MAPASVGRVATQAGSLDLATCTGLATAALKAVTVAEVRELVSGARRNG